MRKKNPKTNSFLHSYGLRMFNPLTRPQEHDCALEKMKTEKKGNEGKGKERWHQAGNVCVPPHSPRKVLSKLCKRPKKKKPT